jgi:hypothetical protein
MEHQLKRRALAAAIVAGAVLGAGCSGGGSSETSDPTLSITSEVATVRADASGVVVNGVDVPSGGTRPVQLDEPVVTNDQARGLLRVGDLEFLLLPKSNMRLVSWDRPAVGSWLESGQLQVTLDADAEPRLRLETSTKVVLRPLEKGTKFYVCQEPPDKPQAGTCLSVFAGEVEWEAKGDVKRFKAGESTFATDGGAATPARCATLHDFDEWLQAALYNKADKDLGGFVSTAPLCGDDSSTSTSTVSTSTVPGTGVIPLPTGTPAKPRPPAQRPPPVPPDTGPAPPVGTPPQPAPTDTPPPTPVPTDTTPPTPVPTDTTPPTPVPTDTTPPVVPPT